MRPDGEKRSCSCKVGWRYRMGRPDASGKRGKPEWSPVFPTKQAADDDQRVQRQAIADGRYAVDGGRTVEAWLTEWLERKERDKRKASTVHGYRRVVENRLVPELGSLRLERLSRHHVQAMLDRMRTEKQLGKGRGHLPVSDGTVRGVHRVLRSALGDAVRAGLLPRNVAEDLILPPVPKHEPVDLGLDAVRQWLTWLNDQEDRLVALWLTTAVYGPRRGEILGLRWLDVDLDGRGAQLVRIEQTVLEIEGDHACTRCGGVHRNVLFDTPKSVAGERVWPLVPVVAEALRRHRERQQIERDAYGRTYSDHDLIFCAPDGGPLNPNAVTDAFGRSFVNSGAAAGLSKVPPMKSLRSTAVTLLYGQGVPLETVARIVGHSGSAGQAVTKRHYLTISAEAVRGELAGIADLLGAARPVER